MHTNLQSENLKERSVLGGVGVDREVILKWFLWTYIMRV
jgi:hypothetical protein